VHAAAPRHRGLWVLTALVPFGLGIWAGFAYAGTKAHVTRWKVYAALYGVVAWAAFLVPSATEAGSDLNAAAGGVIVGVWLVGLAHALLVRPRYLRRMNAMGSQLTAAQERLEQRDEALRIARERPELALELGVGRPDRQGAMDAGLVDVNSAPLEVVQRLPGIDDATGRRIVAIREELDGFASLEDLGMTLDLDGETVEDLRDKVVFLPR
jgi:DNA uptake protein ComE-like DNA-binding protein